MRQITGILFVLLSVMIIFQIQKKSSYKDQDEIKKGVSQSRVNDHLFLTNEKLNLQKEKIEVLHKSDTKQHGSTYEVHHENTIGVDMSTDQRPGKIVNELGREKNLDEIVNPQNEIQNELLKLQAEERESEKKKLQELRQNKNLKTKNKQTSENSK